MKPLAPLRSRSVGPISFQDQRTSVHDERKRGWLIGYFRSVGFHVTAEHFGHQVGHGGVLFLGFFVGVLQTLCSITRTGRPRAALVKSISSGMVDSAGSNALGVGMSAGAARMSACATWGELLGRLGGERFKCRIAVERFEIGVLIDPLTSFGGQGVVQGEAQVGERGIALALKRQDVR